MATVILAEKPDQASCYAAAFARSNRKQGYIEVEDQRFFSGKAFITWGLGHLVELQEPEGYKSEWKSWSLDILPIIPRNFKFQISASKKRQFSIVKKLLKEATNIVVATDCDREGENIARSIITMAGAEKKPTQRLWINSLENDEILRGFHNLRNGNDYLPLYYEAQTRQLADWLVGINSSRLYTLLLQQRGIKGESFSIGRVQTPTLFLIYQRQREIETFKPVPFFELLAKVQAKNGTFTVKYNEKFESKEQVQDLLKNHGIEMNSQGTIRRVEKQIKYQKSPKLHSLSSLQEKANKLWKYSPVEVLRTVQDLYEKKKVLSYPRTDCHYITEAEHRYLLENIESLQLHFDFEITYPQARKGYVESANVQEHHALIPTKKVLSPKEVAELSEKERNIYMEVLSTTAAMFAPDYEYEETKIDLDVNELLFTKTGNVEKKKGWKALFSVSVENSSEPEESLPLVNEGEEITVAMNIRDCMTKPPKPFTEGDLIKVMKTAGYKGKQAVAAEEERAILKETEGIGTEATRADIIETLKSKNYIEVKKNRVAITAKGIILCESINGTLLSSPEMTAKWEIYLKKIGQGEGSQTIFLKNIEKFINHLLKEAPKQLGTTHITTQIEKANAISSVGCCPCCQKPVVDKGKFYGCEGYREGCKFTLPKKRLEKTISEANIKKLLKEKRTGIIKGFKSKKNNKVFEAVLFLDEKNELKMEYPNK